MTRREEREIAREYRRTPVMSPPERRRVIVEFTSTLAAAQHRDPVAAVALLPRLWELRRQLDLGCTSMVCR